MSDSDCILKVDQVSKVYQLGVIGRTTLREDLQRKVALIKGEEDPSLLIGQKERAHGYFKAVDNVSFEAKRGERIALIGKNGAGKSTLLKLICRVTAPTEGRIGYDGKLTSMLEVGTGFHPELTGRENIYLNGAILGMKRSEIDRRFDQIVEFSEVEEHIDTPVKRYSSGMFVRLAFAVAANLPSDIMIMDEVLAVGDIDFQQKCLSRMREVADDENRTIIYVSHNMETVLSLCDRCLVLDSGKLIFDGDIEEGIRLYRGQSFAGSSRDYHDAHEHTHSRRYSEDARILSASFETDFSAVRDELAIKIAWENPYDLPKLCLRVGIHDKLNALLGSKVFFDIEKEYADGLFTIDTSRLQNGSYRTDYSLFILGPTGSERPVDHVEGMPFTINDPLRNAPLIWDSRHWGKISF